MSEIYTVIPSEDGPLMVRLKQQKVVEGLENVYELLETRKVDHSWIDDGLSPVEQNVRQSSK